MKSPYGSSLIDFEETYEGYALKAYRIWLNLFELYRYYSWIIDWFHIPRRCGKPLIAGGNTGFDG